MEINEPVKRRRRTKAEIEQLNQQIVDEIETYHPQSVRHVYYRMTSLRPPMIVVPKTEDGYNKVGWHITKLRREGRIEYSDIVDSTRSGIHVEAYDDAADFLRSTVNYYRHNIWKKLKTWCLVIVESRSLAGVLEDDCNEFGVSLYPLGGFSSITLLYDAAMRINSEHDDRHVVVFYIGDYDPAGVHIDRSAEEEIRLHLDPDVSMEFNRLAITEEQIAEYDLPTKPRKKKDKRALHITHTVEAEALPAPIMRQILREEIEYRLPVGALKKAAAAEKREKAKLIEVASQFQERDRRSKRRRQ